MRLLALLLAAAATPAAAQHAGHHGHAPVEEPPAEQPTAQQPAAEQPAGEDPHAGHHMPEAQSDPHAGHAMPDTAAPGVAPPPAEASAGPEHAADAIYGPVAMAGARETLRREHGDITVSRLLVDRLETRLRDGRDGYVLEADAWHGGDIDKLWVKIEAEGEWGRRLEHLTGQALWSHAIDPWFDLQGGVRYDVNPGRDRTHLVVGVQGLAPYWWEVDGALFLSNRGEVTAKVEAEYDLRITQKLILQPSLEVDLAAQDIDELEVGAGLTSAELGLRLRYQVTPRFGPYVGASYERAFGRTRRFRQAEGADAGSVSFLTGLRFWF